MENFIRWLKQNNVNIDNLKVINQKNNERGILSNKFINEGETVFLIPEHLLITNKTAEKYPEIKQLNNIFQNKTETEKNIIKIAVFMLYAEAYEDIMKEVNWTPYFDILPETLDHIPIFWDDELEYLKGSHMYNTVKKRIKLFKEEYKSIKNEIPNFKVFNFYEYQRMRSIVSSRNFKLYIRGETVSAMVPFADMLNHSPDCQTRWSFNNNLNSYEMTAKKDITKNVEITDSYGIKPLDNYFIYYGFILPNTNVRILINIEGFEEYINNDINNIGFSRLINYIKKSISNKHTNVSVFKLIIKMLQKMKLKYPHTKTYYRRHINSRNQNKNNAYKVIIEELNVIDLLIEKMNILVHYINGKNVDLKYSDVKKYILNNIN